MNSFDEVFDRVIDYCRDVGNIVDVAIKFWIKAMVPVKLEGNKAVFNINSDFQRGVIESQYMDILKEAFKATLGFDVDIEIHVLDDDDSDKPVDVEELSAKQQELKKSYEYAKYDYTFDTFIVGSSNELACAACRAVAEETGGVVYNPLFIYGPSGLGKTHLITATAREMQKRNPDINVIYVTGETFSSEIINAIQTKSTAQFHNKYRTADVLLVDDIQFIAGKDSTQEEFFHTFNALYQDGKQVVLTSDRPPKSIKTLEDRIRSRFEMGFIADIGTPDFETRMAIIKRKAELLDLNIPDDVAQFIANKLKTNIRQLEGAVKRLKAIKHYAGSKPSIAMAQSVIRDVINDEQPEPITVDRIITEVANIYGVTPEDIRSSKRSSQISNARKIAVYVVREITQMPLQQIGAEFGGRDHSTIVYSVNNVTATLKKDPHLKELVDDIIKNINDRTSG